MQMSQFLVYRHLLGMMNAQLSMPAPAKALSIGKDRGSVQDPISAAFSDLFRSVAPKIGRFLAQAVSDRSLADELMQETFLTAWRERASLQDIANPEAWLFAIARNIALNAMRRRRRRTFAFWRLTQERTHAEEDPADAVAVRDFLISHLDPDDRALLLLRYAHGFSSTELAQITGKSPEAVRQQLSRLTRRLAAELAADDPDPSPKAPGE